MTRLEANFVKEVLTPALKEAIEKEDERWAKLLEESIKFFKMPLFNLNEKTGAQESPSKGESRKEKEHGKSVRW